jgi:aldose 1-epimerase
MGLVTITSPDRTARATIRTDLGFNCFHWTGQVDGLLVDGLDAAEDFATAGGRPSGHGTPILFPYPNRIARGQYRWQEQTYELPATRVAHDALGNAIHGFCHDRPWRVVEQTEDSVTGEFQFSVDCPDRLSLWPGDLRLRVQYTVRAHALRSDFEIHNPGPQPVPWGLGTHAYFRLPFVAGTRAEDCLIEAPAAAEWELSEYIPTGIVKPVSPSADLRDGRTRGELQLDHVLTDVGPADTNWTSTLMAPSSGIQITQIASSVFRHVVVFTPPGRDAVCLEPYTCVTNAINLAAADSDPTATSPRPHGLQILAAGQTARAAIQLEMGRVIA